jgi:hypothetical protein
VVTVGIEGGSADTVKEQIRVSNVFYALIFAGWNDNKVSCFNFGWCKVINVNSAFPSKY